MVDSGQLDLKTIEEFIVVCTQIVNRFHFCDILKGEIKSEFTSMRGTKK